MPVPGLAYPRAPSCGFDSGFDEKEPLAIRPMTDDGTRPAVYSEDKNRRGRLCNIEETNFGTNITGKQLDLQSQVGRNKQWERLVECGWPGDSGMSMMGMRLKSSRLSLSRSASLPPLHI